jgi:hypothetical protein
VTTARTAKLLKPSRSGAQHRQRAGRDHLLRATARAGLASRAVIYCLLAYLAFDVGAHGSSPAPASGSGALNEIARQPEGLAMLIVLAVGLGAYAVWRICQLFGRGDPTSKTTVWKRIGWITSGLSYGALCAEAVAVLAGSNSSGGSAARTSAHPAPLVGVVLGWHGGPILVGIFGSALACGGLALAIWGCLHNYNDELDGRLSKRGSSLARATGAFGNLARGLWLILVSVYFIQAAVTDNARHAKGLDGALASLQHDALGPPALVLGAIGLLAFGVFSGIEAAHRRL